MDPLETLWTPYLIPYLRGGVGVVWCIIPCTRGLPVGVYLMCVRYETTLDGTLQKWSRMDPFGPILDLSRPHFGAQDPSEDPLWSGSDRPRGRK